GTVGYFVNPIALRADLSGDPSFSSVLERVRQDVIGALDHDAYPFTLLVQQLQPERDPSRSPLFQIFFALQKPHLPVEALLAPDVDGPDEDASRRAAVTLGGLDVEALPLHKRAAQFDLSLVLTENNGQLAGAFEYNRDLFDRTTIERMSRHFERI